MQQLCKRSYSKMYVCGAGGGGIDLYDLYAVLKSLRTCWQHFDLPFGLQIGYCPLGKALHSLKQPFHRTVLL